MKINILLKSDILDISLRVKNVAKCEISARNMYMQKSCNRHLVLFA